MKQEEKDKLILQLKIIRDSFLGNHISAKDKQLLLEDLNARLLYGVKVATINPAAEFGVVSGISIKGKISVSTKDADIVFECTEVKPYLRTMSSMTQEEREELKEEQIKDEQLFVDCIRNHPEMRGLVIPHFAADWCNKNHFDYRGLIEKGLAIEVNESNNPYKE